MPYLDIRFPNAKPALTQDARKHDASQWREKGINKSIPQTNATQIRRLASGVIDNEFYTAQARELSRLLKNP